MGAKKTKLPIVAGILELVLACISMFIGSMAMTLTIKSGMIDPTLHSQFVVGVFGVVAFPMGLIGGIFAIRRRFLVLAVVGALLMLIWGILLDWHVISVPLSPSDFITGVMFGNVMILLSVLDLALLHTSRAEFT